MKWMAIGLSALSLSATVASAQPRARLGDVDVSTCEAIPSYDLWNSVEREVISGNAIVHAYYMDPEAGSGAMLLIGGDGTGVEPVCLHVTGPDVAVSGAGAGRFAIESGSRSFQLVVDANARVLLDGAMIGQIH